MFVISEEEMERLASNELERRREVVEATELLVSDTLDTEVLLKELLLVVRDELSVVAEDLLSVDVEDALERSVGIDAVDLVVMGVEVVNEVVNERVVVMGIVLLKSLRPKTT